MSLRARELGLFHLCFRRKNKVSQNSNVLKSKTNWIFIIIKYSICHSSLKLLASLMDEKFLLGTIFF